ncbi:MAG: hypothetical protein HY240_03950 [Actinobacteria bacterium]|nr:hypothetical protein [Actinomycetota bacterium]
MANKKRRRKPPARRTTEPEASKRPRPAPDRDTPEKKARRAEARLRREHELRRARRRTTFVRFAAVAAFVAVAVIALQFFGRSSSPTTAASYVTGSPVDPTGLPGLQDGNAPWSKGSDPTALRARLGAVGLPPLASEGNVLHIHQHLDVYVNGKKVPVPAEIGIASDGSFIAPLHTHDASGVIHVEASTQGPFTLGEFFVVWGVKLTPDCLGGYCAKGDEKLQVYVDGELATGDPRQIRLVEHQEIVVAFGTPGQLPNPIPKSYTFPPRM